MNPMFMNLRIISRAVADIRRATSMFTGTIQSYFDAQILEMRQVFSGKEIMQNRHCNITARYIRFSVLNAKRFQEKGGKILFNANNNEAMKADQSLENYYRLTTKGSRFFLIMLYLLG